MTGDDDQKQDAPAAVIPLRSPKNDAARIRTELNRAFARLNKHYILDKNRNVIPVADFMEWAHWFEKMENRKVAWSSFDRYDVSTVFIGLDHRHFGEGPPLIFETMIFAKKSANDDKGGPTNFLDEACFRCSTWEEAEKQHAAACEAVRKAEAEENFGAGCA